MVERHSSKMTVVGSSPARRSMVKSTEQRAKEKEHFYDKSCARKYRYRTHRKALRKKGATVYGKGLRPYKCKFCGWWHLGHPPENKKAR